MEKVVRTEYSGLYPSKKLEKFLEDGWRVKMCHSIRGSCGNEVLEYIITKESEETMTKNWVDLRNCIKCEALNVNDYSNDRRTKGPEEVETVTGCKKDLRSGMVIECRNKANYIIVNIDGYLYGIGFTRFIKMEDYNEDLTYPKNEWDDVTHIWKLKNPITFDNILRLRKQEANWIR